MENEIFSYCTLANGLRIVCQRAHSSVEYCGVAVNTGSRDETTESYGLAHFVEHTIFKGTLHRRSWHIINRMEAVGGELNAYTTKEETIIYSIFPRGNLSRAAELIADLVINSQFPQGELNKEKDVVLDEINSYLDTPSDAIFDDFEDLVFAGSELGHNILGTCKTVSGFSSKDCRDYLLRQYAPKNMVFFYTGPERQEKLFKTVEKYFGALEREEPSLSRKQVVVSAPFDKVKQIGCYQAHTIIGAPLPSMYSPMRHAIALLTNIIGGPGMNSLLNIALRERRGLVYNVEASSVLFTDAGIFTIYFGSDRDDVPSCRKLTCSILEKLSSEELSENALKTAKKQYLGQLIVASDNREQSAIASARGLLYYDHVTTAQETIDLVESITSAQLLEAARLIVPGRCSTLTMI